MNNCIDITSHFLAESIRRELCIHEENPLLSAGGKHLLNMKEDMLKRLKAKEEKDKFPLMWFDVYSKTDIKG